MAQLVAQALGIGGDTVETQQHRQRPEPRIRGGRRGRPAGQRVHGISRTLEDDRMETGDSEPGAGP